MNQKNINKKTVSLKNPLKPASFQKILLAWFNEHGRKHLPWQENKTAYRVWVSEIMLQQTQVSTVIPYFERFMQQFPDLSALAQASEDSVLHLWAGLGYYSRARNLHRAAKMIVEKFAGIFPQTIEDLEALPGVGQSTAGAIAAIAYNQKAAILDGNVKRVFARLHGITAAINEKEIENKLWELAHLFTPAKEVADYTQAIMDFGATLCLRSKPQCMLCPFTSHCLAHQQGIAASLPKKKPTKKLPVRTSTFIILKKNERIFLQKRAANGIWGGLWSLPEIAGEPQTSSLQTFCLEQWQLKIKDFELLAPFRHTFTHYHLDIFPVIIHAKQVAIKNMKKAQQIWYDPNKPDTIGLPKPV
ncbi:MAG: A/G-specific adenine glycosylase, partial [Gammaproteobacteria bacterium]|nr:A/G-specific adenine glycosylase [Gammaproteobacteria bacterium]